MRCSLLYVHVHVRLGLSVRGIRNAQTTSIMPSPPFVALEEGASIQGGRRPVDINVMKRNMTVAKGFLDVSLLTANANQLRNVMVFGNTESHMHYWILSGIVICLIMQLTAGVLLILGERFDINKEDEQHHGDLMNTVVTCLIFLVLILNVIIASFGVDLAEPPNQQYPGPYPPGKGSYPIDNKGVDSDIFKHHLG